MRTVEVRPEIVEETQEVSEERPEDIEQISGNRVRLTESEIQLCQDKQAIEGFITLLKSSPPDTKIALYHSSRDGIEGVLNFMRNSDMGLRQFKRDYSWSHDLLPSQDNPCLGIVPMVKWSDERAGGLAYFVPRGEIAFPGEPMEGKRIQIDQRGVAGIIAPREQAYLSLLDVEGKVIIGPKTEITPMQDQQIERINSWLTESQQTLEPTEKAVELARKNYMEALNKFKEFYLKEVPQEIKSPLGDYHHQGDESDLHFMTVSTMRSPVNIPSIVNRSISKELGSLHTGIKETAERLNLEINKSITQRSQFLEKDQELGERLKSALVNQEKSQRFTSRLFGQQKKINQKFFEEITTLIGQEHVPTYSTDPLVWRNFVDRRITTLSEKIIEKEQHIEQLRRVQDQLHLYVGLIESCAQSFQDKADEAIAAFKNIYS